MHPMVHAPTVRRCASCDCVCGIRHSLMFPSIVNKVIEEYCWAIQLAYTIPGLLAFASPNGESIWKLDCNSNKIIAIDLVRNKWLAEFPFTDELETHSASTLGLIQRYEGKRYSLHVNGEKNICDQPYPKRRCWCFECDLYPDEEWRYVVGEDDKVYKRTKSGNELVDLPPVCELTRFAPYLAPNEKWLLIVTSRGQAHVKEYGVEIYQVTSHTSPTYIMSTRIISSHPTVRWADDSRSFMIEETIYRIVNAFTD